MRTGEFRSGGGGYWKMASLCFVGAARCNVCACSDNAKLTPLRASDSTRLLRLNAPVRLHPPGLGQRASRRTPATAACC